MVSIDPIFIAFTAIILMAIAPIVIGSFKSLPSSKVKKEKEVLTMREAWMAPLVGSIVLFTLFILIKFFSRDIINILITGYITLFGSITLAQLLVGELRTFLSAIFGIKFDDYPPSPQAQPSGVESPPLESNLFGQPTGGQREDGSPTNSQRETELPKDNQKEQKDKKPPFTIQSIFNSIKVKFSTKEGSLFSFSFDILDLLGLGFVAIFATFYLLYKHWIINNIYGEAICLGAIAFLHLDSFIHGAILLAGLFFYDIFWVFGTEVMVTVAQSFDAPLLLRFPRDLFAQTYQWTMLGLGDIVVPGLFIALCLRYDHDNAKRPDTFSFKKPYFYACLVAYVLGLITTIVVMFVFKAAQPALLYLSPACIISVLLTSFVLDDFSNVWNYSSSLNDETKDNLNSDEPKTQ